MRVDTISVLLDRYGQCVTLYRGGVEPGREVRAFLQPLREAGREQARPSPLGLRREDRYLMLGEPDVPAAPGTGWCGGRADMRSAPPTPSIWGSGCPTGGQCWPPGARRRHERRTGTDPGGADRPPQWEGYPGSTCLERDGADVPRRPVAAVSLRGCRWGPAGFQDYLGERYDPEAGRWEELYGRRVKLTFGLDLYGERAQGDQALQAAFDALAGALHREGPPGMRLLELSCGETEYDQGGQLLRRPVEAVYEACLYAAGGAGRPFPGL